MVVRNNTPTLDKHCGEQGGAVFGAVNGKYKGTDIQTHTHHTHTPVSYTHLTLPTSCCV